ncbi:MAG: hypothetical protein AB8G15_14710 [Saprospiraceae bacterium]
MIKTLLKLGILLAIGIVSYNYFFGTEAEKEVSRNIFAQTKKIGKSTLELGKSTLDLFKSEREKLDQGKYDGALEKITGLFDKMKDEVKENSHILQRIKELEAKKDKLSEKAKETSEETGAAAKADKEKLVEEIKELYDEAEELAKEAKAAEKQ